MTCNKKDVRARQGSNAEKDFSRRGQKNTQERQGCGFWSPFLLAAAVQYDIVIFFGLSVTRNFLENILNFFFEPIPPFGQVRALYFSPGPLSGHFILDATFPAASGLHGLAVGRVLLDPLVAVGPAVDLDLLDLGAISFLEDLLGAAAGRPLGRGGANDVSQRC